MNKVYFFYKPNGILCHIDNAELSYLEILENMSLEKLIPSKVEYEEKAEEEFEELDEEEKEEIISNEEKEEWIRQKTLDLYLEDNDFNFYEPEEFDEETLNYMIKEYPEEILNDPVLEKKIYEFDDLIETWKGIKDKYRNISS